jgi:hypothetical protein
MPLAEAAAAMCAPAFPIADLLDEDLCCLWLMRARWPGAKPICPKCGGVFSVYTGTIFPRTRRSCREVILILRGFARGVSTSCRYATRTTPPLSGGAHLRVVKDSSAT